MAQPAIEGTLPRLARARHFSDEERAAIDAELRRMAKDEAYQAEADRIDREFATALRSVIRSERCPSPA
jgi:hypothetical protein